MGGYELAWNNGPFIQSSGGIDGISWNAGSYGSLEVIGSENRQWHAWTYVYVKDPKTLSLINVEGDCIPRIFLNENFDNPIEFPGQINLVAGLNRIDLTGYNQNDNYIFNLNFPLSGKVEIMNSSLLEDTDKDGIFDICDNCPSNCNTQQLNADDDGDGDVCDSTPSCGGCGQPACETSCDLDFDGIFNTEDNCPDNCNTFQLDADGDNVGDVCDSDDGCFSCGDTGPICEQEC